MVENGYFSDAVTPKPPAVTGNIFNVTLKNNYANAIAGVYKRDFSTGNWGDNLISSPIVTNNSRLLGTYAEDDYELMAESVSYYRVNTGTSDVGLNITGGVLDGYQPVYYLSPEIALTQDITITVPAAGWLKIKPSN